MKAICWFLETQTEASALRILPSCFHDLTNEVAQMALRVVGFNAPASLSSVLCEVGEELLPPMLVNHLVASLVAAGDLGLCCSDGVLVLCNWQQQAVVTKFVVGEGVGRRRQHQDGSLWRVMLRVCTCCLRWK